MIVLLRAPDNTPGGLARPGLTARSLPSLLNAHSLPLHLAFYECCSGSGHARRSFPYPAHIKDSIFNFTFTKYLRPKNLLLYEMAN